MTESEASSRGCAVTTRRSRRYSARVAVVQGDLHQPSHPVSLVLFGKWTQPCHPPSFISNLWVRDPDRDKLECP